MFNNEDLPDDADTHKADVIKEVRRLLDQNKINHFLIFDLECQAYGRSWRMAHSDDLPEDVLAEYKTKFYQELCYNVFDMVLNPIAAKYRENHQPPPTAEVIMNTIYSLAMAKYKDDTEGGVFYGIGK